MARGINKHVKLGVFLVVLLVISMLPLNAFATAEDEIVVFKDINLETAVRDIIGKPSGEVIPNIAERTLEEIQSLIPDIRK